jgi:hypothetical protein
MLRKIFNIFVVIVVHLKVFFLVFMLCSEVCLFVCSDVLDEWLTTLCDSVPTSEVGCGGMHHRPWSSDIAQWH